LETQKADWITINPPWSRIWRILQQAMRVVVDYRCDDVQSVQEHHDLHTSNYEVT